MEVHICTIELPCNVHGVSEKSEESITIYINANDPITDRLKTCFRGLARLKYGHFESDVPYKECNRQADRYAKAKIRKATASL